MIIVSEKPPFFEELYKRFKLSRFVWEEGLIITYAPFVYCQDNLDRFPEKIVHESVHLEQQGKDPKAWWKRYFDEDYFRLEQEVDAYGAEVRWIVDNVKDRNKRFQMIHRISTDLSSSMYGNIISQSEAIKLFMNMTHFKKKKPRPRY